MKIYMVQHKKSSIVLGVWTNPDQLADMIGTRCSSLESPSGGTALEEFMYCHRLCVYKDGVVDNTNKFAPWSEIFPTE